MKNSKNAFTMIELIFVMIILGILAIVAIPRLAATRDDAKIVKMVTNVKLAQSGITAYTLAQGKVIDDNASMYEAANVFASDTVIFNGLSGEIGIVFLDGPNNGSASPCVFIEVNATHMITTNIPSSSSTICSAVAAKITEGNVSIGGQGINN